MNRLQKFIGVTLAAIMLGCTPAGKEAVNADEPAQPQQPQSVLPSNLRDSLPPLPPTQAEREAQLSTDAALIAQAKQELYDLGVEYCTRLGHPNPEQHAQNLVELFDFYFDDCIEAAKILQSSNSLAFYVKSSAESAWRYFTNRHPEVEITR